MATVIINSKEDADMVTAGMTEVTVDEFYDVVGPLDVIHQDGRYIHTSLFVERYGVEPVGVEQGFGRAEGFAGDAEYSGLGFEVGECAADVGVV